MFWILAKAIRSICEAPSVWELFVLLCLFTTCQKPVQTSLQNWGPIVLFCCTVVQLYCLTVVLLCFCTDMLLYCCTVVLLYCCTVVLYWFCSTGPCSLPTWYLAVQGSLCTHSTIGTDRWTLLWVILSNMNQAQIVTPIKHPTSQTNF